MDETIDGGRPSPAKAENATKRPKCERERALGWIGVLCNGRPAIRGKHEGPDTNSEQTEQTEKVELPGYGHERFAALGPSSSCPIHSLNSIMSSFASAFLRTSRAALRSNGAANPVQAAWGSRGGAYMRNYATAFERNKPHVNIGPSPRSISPLCCD